MDVEAQEDGILAKIIVRMVDNVDETIMLTRSQQGDNSKGVQVGTRIAVTAEPGDDISSLEIPAEDKADAPKEQPKQESSPAPKKEATQPPPKPASSGSSKTAGGKAQKQTYPLYPSVQHLLKVNGLPKEEADKIPATGPNGRLLKGDVLVYLGSIQKSSASEVAERLKKLSHLDLSNIKPAAPKKADAPEKAATAPEPVVVEELPVEVALPVSLKAVMECQKRVQESIGVLLPVSTFIARAAELANEDLPRSKLSKPSTDELFNAVLGLDKIAGKKLSRGHFIPQITALPPTTLRSRTPATKKPDVLDFLAGKKPVATKAPVTGGAEKVIAPMNVFSVSVPKGDERRGRVFLERVKSVLEVEPGRLVV
jgi:pyruvate/2-oxoglutarate dehydrogenase complex dihydrolipoamide acyltransferase (E2) component